MRCSCRMVSWWSLMSIKSNRMEVSLENWISGFGVTRVWWMDVFLFVFGTSAFAFVIALPSINQFSISYYYVLWILTVVLVRHVNIGHERTRHTNAAYRHRQSFLTYVCLSARTFRLLTDRFICIKTSNSKIEKRRRRGRNEKTAVHVSTGDWNRINRSNFDWRRTIVIHQMDACMTCDYFSIVAILNHAIVHAHNATSHNAAWTSGD